MERELFHHIQKHARKVAGATIKSHRTYPINKVYSTDLPSENKLQNECIKEMKEQWTLFKDHFSTELLPMMGDIEDIITWYFNKEPPFTESKKSEFPDAFIISALDQYHRQHYSNIAVISRDNDFKEACQIRSYLKHFESIQAYIDAFEPDSSNPEPVSEGIDFTRPIVTEDLTEMKAILSQESPTLIEIDIVLNQLQRKGTNYDYFFKYADNFFLV